MARRLEYASHGFLNRPAHLITYSVRIIAGPLAEKCDTCTPLDELQGGGRLGERERHGERERVGPSLRREDGWTGDSWPNLTSPRTPVDAAREKCFLKKGDAARRSALGRFRGEKQMPPRGNWQTLASFFGGGWTS